MSIMRASTAGSGGGVSSYASASSSLARRQGSLIRWGVAMILSSVQYPGWGLEGEVMDVEGRVSAKTFG